MVSSTKVKVHQGTVVGGEGVLPNGNQYYYFKGIPYAVPPLGALRFKAPVPLKRFLSAEIDCTKEGEVSFQKCGFTGNIIGSEDCLFLNVYAPKSQSDAILPVMVYLHGGGFAFGSGNSDLYNPLYLLQEDVVVVTLNYRVGPLGFVSLPEANIPGNAGLKDQRLALQWVKENIAQFSGDPNNVTLFGESAGGACVHLHFLSEHSRKFFHKAIAQSGLANMTWTIDDKGPCNTEKLAKSLGCTSNDPFEIIKFLQEYPDLNGFVKPFLSGPSVDDIFYGRPVPTSPVIEKDSPEAVIPKSLIMLMSEENTIDIPLMMGYNSAEGMVIIPAVADKLEFFEKDLRNLIPKNINLRSDDPRRLELANLIKDFYFKGEKLDEKTMQNFVHLLGDNFFIIEAHSNVEIHSRKQHKSPLFFYRFDYDGALNLYKKLYKVEQLKGASHADDLFYIFQATMAPEPWEEKAKKMVQKICKLWTNFAKYGNPTPEPADPFVEVVWEPVKKINDTDDFVLNAFVIDEHEKMLEKPDEERMNFWRNVKKTYNTSN